MNPDEHGNFIRADSDRNPDAKERAEIERREKIDDNFLGIEARFVCLEKKIDQNTEVTTQIRDILTSFRVIGAVSKWLTAMGALGVMLYHAWQKATGR